MKLKSCPFCGGEAEIKKRGFYYTPCCKDPYCAGRLSKKYLSEEAAVSVWNRRPSNMSAYMNIDRGMQLCRK